MINRAEARALVETHVANRNLVKHMLAVEAVMRGLARRFGEDEELWGVTGLLHDLDYTVTVDNPARHAHVTCEMLAGKLPAEALHAILAHPEHVPPESRFDWALYCSDPVTGLVVAAALMHPTRKLASLDLDFLKRRFQEKRFAAGANREQIQQCRQVGLELDDFLQLALTAMQGIAGELGL